MPSATAHNQAPSRRPIRGSTASVAADAAIRVRDSWHDRHWSYDSTQDTRSIARKAKRAARLQRKLARLDDATLAALLARAREVAAS